ncbi:MAG: hypothetical protein WC760_01285 [Bacteroidia bacterium]
MKKIVCIIGLLTTGIVNGQTTKTPELKWNLNESGSLYLKSNLTAQIWLRYTDNNSGSTIQGKEVPHIFDIGLRRVRAQFYGQLQPHIFFYAQAGINNFSYNSARKPGLFLHDMAFEYQITPRAIQLGAGLTGWTGFLRYSSPSVASILAYDAPLYQQATNDVNDQFLRKLSVYIKGKIGKLDYRLVCSDPFLIDSTIGTVKKINTYSDFAYTLPKAQYSGYGMWQFMDEESNITPYTTGTYLGKKRILNLGTGFQFQPKAMWHYSDAIVKDTMYQNLLNIGIDFFMDQPIGNQGSALTVYAAYSNTNYGKNYIRNNGAMNPVIAGTSFSGGGNSFPMYGTGTTFFGQLGYLLPRKILGEKGGQLQPYTNLLVSNFDRLNSRVIVWDIGFNWIIDGHRTKISLNYQNRPVLDPIRLNETDRKGQVCMQLQIAI